MNKQIATFKFQDKQPTIFVTDDYKIFKYSKGNRAEGLLDDIENGHSISIADSIKKEYQFTLIIVNEKFEVIDGQHRISALRSLGLPVYYTVISGYNGSQMHQYNQHSKNWKDIDYANFFAERGKQDYKVLIDIKNRFKHIPISALIPICSSGESGYFKSGKFKLNTDQHVVEYWITMLMDFEQFYESYNSIKFIRACVQMFKTPGYEHARMLQSMRIRSNKLLEGSSISKYRIDLTTIYNAGVPRRKWISFYTNEDIKEVSGIHTI